MKCFLLAALMGVSFAAKQDNYYNVDEPTVEIQPAPYTQLGDSWSLGALTELAKGNENVQDMAADMTADVMAYYQAQIDALPDVCEGGQACRDDILKQARQDINDLWQTALDQIAHEIEKLHVVSNDHIENALAAGEECDDGCIPTPEPPTPVDPSDIMICTSSGDPHILTYSERKVDVMGHGVFPLSTTEGVVVEAFHCPTTKKWIGNSMNVGVAMEVETDFGVQHIQVIGDDIWINGVLSNQSTDAVQLTYWEKEKRVRVSVGQMMLIVNTKRTDNVPTNFFQNLKVEVLFEDNLSSMYGPTICGVTEGARKQDMTMHIIKSSQTLFSADNYAWLVEKCGVPEDDDYEIPEVPLTPEEICTEMGVSYEDAANACSSCSCEDQAIIDECIYDYCALGGDMQAVASCEDSCYDDCEDYDDGCKPTIVIPRPPTEPECDEGVANQYTYYVTTIQELQDEIKDMEDQIDDLWKQIAAIDEQCPEYHYLHEQYETEWMVWDGSNTGSAYWPL